jgi:3-oxosteroid 1-dehydrogenase
VVSSNSSLGEISHPPYYAVKMVPGDLGTKGGVRTDVHARALHCTSLHIAGAARPAPSSPETR